MLAILRGGMHSTILSGPNRVVSYVLVPGTPIPLPLDIPMPPPIIIEMMSQRPIDVTQGGEAYLNYGN